MKHRIALLSMASLALLSGCSFINQFIRPGTEEVQTPPAQEQPKQEESKQEQSKPSVNSQRQAQEREIKQKFGEEGGEYRDYRDGDIGNGKDAVLFFHASWCPDCQRNDNNLEDWFSANYIPISVYKVDYDSAIGLKQRYGVVQQDTFVRIDGEGRSTSSKSFPSEIDLLNMLRP